MGDSLELQNRCPFEPKEGPITALMPSEQLLTSCAPKITLERNQWRGNPRRSTTTLSLEFCLAPAKWSRALLAVLSTVLQPHSSDDSNPLASKDDTCQHSGTISPVRKLRAQKNATGHQKFTRPEFLNGEIVKHKTSLVCQGTLYPHHCERLCASSQTATRPEPKWRLRSTKIQPLQPFPSRMVPFQYAEKTTILEGNCRIRSSVSFSYVAEKDLEQKRYYFRSPIRITV
eukprot:g76980.t1